jgi:heme-degrading monooxygenase HmoA
MHARVLRLTGTADKVDDGVSNYASRVAPALREQDGYGGARLLVDRDTGASMSITFWRDEDASRASFEALRSIRADATSRFGSTEPETKLYEAAVQHRPKPTETGNWVRLSTLNGDPAKIDDGIRHFESQSVPQLEKLPGFRAAILLVDRATGEAIAATVWDGKSDLEGSSSQAAPIRSAAADTFGASGVRVENFGVAFAELLAAAGR